MVEVKLVIVGGGTEGDEFRPNLPAILGRSREATLPLPHPLVSRQHCELLAKDDSLFVRDLGSTNGTFVGSERVDGEMLIEHGQLLTIGTVTFRALYDGQTLRPAEEDVADVAEDVVVPAKPQRSVDTASISCIDTGRIETGRADVPQPTTPNSSPRRTRRHRAK